MSSPTSVPENTAIFTAMEGTPEKATNASRPAPYSPATDDAKVEAKSELSATESQSDDTADKDKEEGEIDEREEAITKGKNRAEEEQSAETVANPPLPAGPPPPAEDDGWDFHWDQAHQAYFFHNRFTGETTWENPRIPSAASAPTAAAAAAATATAADASPPSDPSAQVDVSGGKPAVLNSASLPPPPTTALPAGGYNPAVHGDYDPNAWYARAQTAAEEAQEDAQSRAAAAAELHAATGTFNRFTGRFQAGEGAEKHGDEAKSRRQLNAFFDVDAAANQHDGRSLKAERSGIKPSKKEIKRFKEKRRAKKEEKRRAWLKE